MSAMPLIAPQKPIASDAVGQNKRSTPSHVISGLPSTAASRQVLGFVGRGHKESLAALGGILSDPVVALLQRAHAIVHHQAPPVSFAVICATCLPWYRAPSSSLALGWREPSTLASVLAP